MLPEGRFVSFISSTPCTVTRAEPRWLNGRYFSGGGIVLVSQLFRVKVGSPSSTFKAESPVHTIKHIQTRKSCTKEHQERFYGEPRYAQSEQHLAVPEKQPFLIER